ncbi:duplicated ATPase component CbrU of energizing module of predicted cobalamin ECF transporter [Lachnospiraceae bacterium KM106-2]|nr:duplicated ATPase component CbrU of energizing module of predicted cobalamin ECF transporter [Lachnospiraceae bacterium KM106-2]
MEHIKIEHLSFNYPEEEKPALNDISLSIKKGEYIVICGISGSGKSTLLQQLKPAMSPHGNREGTIYFEDQELSTLSFEEQSSKIGFVMQDPSQQIVTDKVWHELAFGLENLGLSQEVIRQRVAENANYFGIQTWFHKKVTSLSGGQKQLLNLAAVMAMQPDVLILDEPTSQLDPIAAEEFLNTIRKINADLGVTVIITEHRLEEIAPFADRMIVIDEGKICLDAPIRKAASILHELEHPMFEALPTPMKVYAALKKKDGGESPITIREGRNFLSETITEHRELGLPKEEKIEDSEVIAQMKEVYFRYEKKETDILRGVNLQIGQTDIYAIVGGNGSGKTTMLKVLSGSLRPYAGKVKYAKGQLSQNEIALLPQDPLSILIHRSVREDLIEMIATSDGAEQTVLAMADKFGIQHLLDRNPSDLSGGEKQRAAIAKVMLRNPKLLLLDEPTKGMDADRKQQFAKLLKELTKEGVSIVIVSHDIEFCARYATKVSMFFDGIIMATNTPRKFFANNNFYTTAANRMCRHICKDAITEEDVIILCQS